MSHYYQFDANLKSDKRILNIYLKDQKLSFTSDVGVFSNDKIDYGSFTFIKSLLDESNVDTLLDVGCGYGVIGICLKYFNKANKVDMIDVNPRAVELTQLNANSYHLENVNAFISDGFLNVTSNYDKIVINPPIRAGKAVIYKMFDDSYNHLNDNGELWIVIKKDLGANSAIKKLETLFEDVLVVKKDKGYFIIKSFNKKSDINSNNANNI